MKVGIVAALSLCNVLESFCLLKMGKAGWQDGELPSTYRGKDNKA